MAIKNGGQGRVSRRGFFGASAAVYGGVVGGAGLFQALVARDAFAQGGGPRRRGPGYGNLEPAGLDLLLPPGFRYAVVSEEGQIMNDGFP
ncbi:MAG TPA: hypothetical protein VM029_00085, partial [Opitutaceae bacterium]|nr:hypothetical protein [Opitutaceae bacterium]